MVDRLLKHAPFILTVLCSVIAIGITYGEARGKINTLQQRLEVVETNGSIPVAKISEKLDALREDVAEVKQDIREVKNQMASGK